MYLYLNGTIKKREDAVISPFDHGYMYGVGLFETLRTYDGHPFLLDDHLTRLKEGLEELNIHWFYKREDILSILKNLLQTNGLQDAYIRLNVSAGIDDIGLKVNPYIEPTTIMYMKPLPVLRNAAKEGVILKTRRNSPEGAQRLKSHHYLNNILAKREIGGESSKEGIFLTKEGYIAEGIVSNLFFIKNRKVFTPSLETGILNGITRQFIMALLRKMKVEVVEGLFTIEQLLESDEIFVTNSVQEICPIFKIENNQYAHGDNTFTFQLQLMYQNFCRSLWSRHDLAERDVEYED